VHDHQKSKITIAKAKYNTMRWLKKNIQKTLLQDLQHVQISIAVYITLHYIVRYWFDIIIKNEKRRGKTKDTRSKSEIVN